MMADGVEADMSFRDATTLEIRRNEMMDDRQQVEVVIYPIWKYTDACCHGTDELLENLHERMN